MDIVNAFSPEFGEIIRFPNTQTYWEFNLPYGSTKEIDSLGINVSYKNIELYLHHSKRTEGNNDFYNLLPKEIYDFNKEIMQLRIDNITEYNKDKWNVFRAGLLVPVTSEKVALVYIAYDDTDVITFLISSKEKKWEECQSLVDNVLLSMHPLSLDNVLTDCLRGRLIILKYPYNMPYVKKRTHNGIAAICITKENIQLFVYVKIYNSFAEARKRYDKIKKDAVDKFSFNIIRINKFSPIALVYYTGKDSSLSHSLTLLTCIAQKDNCVIVLHLPTTDLLRDMTLCGDIIENATL